MPRTGWSFIVGALALSGIFPLAGFWSKDEILADAFKAFQGHGEFGVGEGMSLFVWILLTAAAFLTAFYTGRQIFMTFTGKPRSRAAEHAPESVGSMTWPLMILASFAAVLGLFGTPWFHLFHKFVGERANIIGTAIAHGEFNLIIALVSVFLAVLGWILAWAIYGRKPLVAAVDPLERPLGAVYRVLKNKYYVDELYQWAIIRPVIGLASACYAFDDKIVIDPIVDGVGRFGRWLAEWLKKAVDNPVEDGAVNGVGWLTAQAGEFMRATQTGQVQNYLLVAAVTILLLLGLFLWRA
jgi:NADH-quinone oxidoreductase subunit L